MVILLAGSSTFVTCPSIISAWASTDCGCEAVPKPKATAAARVSLRTICLLCVLRPSFHDDSSEHLSVVVPRDQAGELEFTAFCELPDQVNAAPNRDPFCIRVVVLHFREPFHFIGVLAVLGWRCESKLMRSCALVLQ